MRALARADHHHRPEPSRSWHCDYEMNIVLLTHPSFLGSQSHPHFARMLCEAYRERGHQVELRQPRAVAHAWVVARGKRWARWTKWAGYIDQYLLFPKALRALASQDPSHTLYVFCDQALGPWIPVLKHRPHVVHCHDLLALRSALGLVPENPTSATGRLYQRYIRHGFKQARHFVSISKKTKADLHAYGGVQPITSEVVYNGLNHPYRRQPREQALLTLAQARLPAIPEADMLLHVGGGQWYKNTAGVVQLYAHFARNAVQAGQAVPALWMVSPPPGPEVQRALQGVPSEGQVLFFQKLDGTVIEALYSTARALLFPSLAEGFGWPIAEGLACGCPVVTTAEPPMNEVGGRWANYLPRLTHSTEISLWAAQGASLLQELLNRSAEQQASVAAMGVEWAQRYDARRATDAYLRIYEDVIKGERNEDRT